MGAKIGIGIGASHLVGAVFCALGALVGGGWSSWMAAPTNKVKDANDDFPMFQEVCKSIVTENISINEGVIVIKDKNTYDKINISSDILNKTKLSDNSLKVAKMHNIALSSLDVSVELKQTTLNISEETKLKDAIMNSKEFMDSCKVVGIRAQSCQLSHTDDITAKVISLFNRVVKEYSSKTDDMAIIIEKYMEIINSSTELTKEQKEIVEYGLATGLYSSNYWDYRFQELDIE